MKLMIFLHFSISVLFGVFFHTYCTVVVLCSLSEIFNYAIAHLHTYIAS